MAKIVLYHGTARHFEHFAGSFEHMGVEANSALGVHLTEDPALAAEYAELASRDVGSGEPIVLAVEAEVKRIGIICSREDYLGLSDGNPAQKRSRDEFARARHHLLEQGFDGVTADELGDDLSLSWVLFRPECLKIIDRHTVPVAENMEIKPLPEGIKFEVVQLFSSLEADLAHSF